MMRYVRVFAEPTVDNPESHPLSVDAIIDDAGNILGRHALFGLSGNFERADEHFEPFVLSSKGRADWGDGFDASNDRYGDTDLRDGPLIAGRLFSFTTNDWGTERYRIARIVELPAT
jgi:hypothetical protein